MMTTTATMTTTMLILLMKMWKITIFLLKKQTKSMRLITESMFSKVSEKSLGPIQSTLWVPDWEHFLLSSSNQVIKLSTDLYTVSR